MSFIGRTPMRYCLPWLVLAVPAILNAQGIRGRVSDATTRAPIVAARVRLTTLDGQTVGEAIEVYHGSASAPAQFAGKNAPCGVLVIWMKRGAG
jgi:hypothetical protein